MSTSSPSQLDAIRLGLKLGWNDVQNSYRRSVLGQFWITLGMAVTIGSIGVVFGLIFGSPMEIFLPYVASGIIVWGLFSGILNEGSQAFITAQALISQIPIPKMVHVVRVIWRNLLVFGHNIIIFPVAVILVGGSSGWASALFPLGLLISVTAFSGLALLVSVASVRYRDLPPIVNSIVTVSFYVTPVIWMADNLGDSELAHLVLGLNPLYHLLQVTRLPLLGEFPTIQNWSLATLAALVFSAFGLAVFQKYKNRIPYWV